MVSDSLPSSLQRRLWSFSHQGFLPSPKLSCPPLIAFSSFAAADGFMQIRPIIFNHSKIHIVLWVLCRWIQLACFFENPLRSREQSLAWLCSAAGGRVCGHSQSCCHRGITATTSGMSCTWLNCISSSGQAKIFSVTVSYLELWHCILVNS